MSAALLLAILKLAPTIIPLAEMLIKMIEGFVAAGHPANAPLTDDHIKAIQQVVSEQIQFTNGPQTWENPTGGE